MSVTENIREGQKSTPLLRRIGNVMKNTIEGITSHNTSLEKSASCSVSCPSMCNQIKVAIDARGREMSNAPAIVLRFANSEAATIRAPDRKIRMRNWYQCTGTSLVRGFVVLPVVSVSSVVFFSA